MSALEQEIIEKFRSLDKDARKRVQALIAHEIEAVPDDDLMRFDVEAWLATMDRVRITARIPVV